MSTLQRTNVDLSGLMRVLGEALYSTPHVAIRELVQNAHDSCIRRRIESPHAFEPAIDVTSVPGTLIITDTGAGLTAEEIHSYLATIGSGYTRTLREAGSEEGLIGYFGLGFLSAFAISERVEVWTCSYKDPAVANRFVSRSGETYTVDRADARPVGTEVRLTLKPQFAELSDAHVVLERLNRYCSLLPLPISCNRGAPINALQPPWRYGEEVSALRRRTLSLEFAKRFERTFEPLVTFPISDPATHLGGLLWIQDGGSYATSDNRNVSVFVRGMLIGEDERELLPRWAGFVGGVIESKSLKPTASRESLKKDEMYEQTAVVLRRCLIESLSKLASEDPATWRRVLARHNEALLGAALADPNLFALVADDVTVTTTEGEFTLPALLERGRGKVFVTQGDKAGVEAILLRALRTPVVLGTRFAASPFCSRYVANGRGELVMLGTQRGDSSIFRAADLDDALAAQLTQWFAHPDREILIRAFEPSFLPFALVTDRDAELKRRLESDEADRRIGQAVLSLARQFTRKIDAGAAIRMYVNASNPLVRALCAAEPERRARALALLQPLSLLVSDAQARANFEETLLAFNDALLAILEGR